LISSSTPFFIDNRGVWESNPPTGGVTRSTELQSRGHASRLTQQALSVRGVFGLSRMRPSSPRRCRRWGGVTAVSGQPLPTSRIERVSSRRSPRSRWVALGADPRGSSPVSTATPCRIIPPSPVPAVTDARAVPGLHTGKSARRLGVPRCPWSRRSHGTPSDSSQAMHPCADDTWASGRLRRGVYHE